MEGEVQRLIKVWFTVIASLSYCYFIPTKIPKGKIRLLFLLPIFPLFTLLPLYLSSIHLIGITTFFFTWLANFKLLLFAFNLGPLSSNPPLSLLHFISTACLPIKIKQDPLHNIKNKENPSLQITKKGLKSPLNYAIKALLLAIVIRIYDYKQYIHPNIILTLYCCHIYFASEIIFATCAAPVHTVLGIEIESQFNEPYLSSSLQDFWGRSWNLMVPSILRPTVYEPMRSTAIPIVGRRCSLLLAVLVTFFVSGLMHELFYFYFTRVRPTWEVTWFFVLHGICVAVEIAVKKKTKFQLHRAVSGSLTIGFVSVTGFWLFFPQIVRNGVDVRVIGEYGALFDFVKHDLSLLFNRTS